jgi:2-polyprenyl-3-methyl-5-hydroxy-6-metoxy-1,4-benzoquinol methylase
VSVPREDQDVVGRNDFSTFLHNQVRARELKRLPEGAGTVLHGGCAGSWYFEWFEECYRTRVERHIGVEAFSPRPEDLPEHVEWLATTLGDLTPVRDGEVDLIYAGQVLEHAWPEDIAAFFSEAHRVLRLGGTIALDSPNRRVTSAVGWMHPEHTVEFTVDEITELLRLAGFGDVRVRGMWLSYDAHDHRFLPLEELEDGGDWPWSRRVAEAEARPEDSFIWWAEATRASTPPDEKELSERVQQIYDRYRQLRFADFKHEIGNLSRQGDHWIVEAGLGEGGYLLYGPNVPMPPGRWAAKFRVGQMNGAQGGPGAEAVSLGSLDIVTGLDATPIASRVVTLEEISSDGALHELVLPFQLARTEMGVQFRLHTTGQVRLCAELGVSIEEDQPRVRRTAVRFADVDDRSDNGRENDPAGSASDRAEVETQSGTPSDGLAGRRGLGRSIARTILWPLRRFFDPRIAGLAQAIEVTKNHLSDHVAVQSGQIREQMQSEAAALAERGLETQHAIGEVRALVEADLDAATEAATIVGQGLDELRGLGEATEAALRRIEGRLPSEVYRQLADDGRVEELDEAAAGFLNYASSHRGFAAQRHLWFNWPVSISHEPGDVTLANVNERVAEVTYAFRALAGVRPGAKILDVGASESTVALSLASLGYDVTAIDPRPYPVEHPRLRIVVGSVEEWDSGETFAAILCISTLEHIGSGEYGQAATTDADAAALRRLHALTDRDGLLVLTTPFGDSHPSGDSRVYDRATLEALLSDWSIEDFTIVGRKDATTWSPTNEAELASEAVALITARRKD